MIRKSPCNHKSDCRVHTEVQLRRDYYIHHRYYDPQLCRWINADSLASTGQGFLGCNMFTYCRNNPANRIDISGVYDRDASVAYAEEWSDEYNSDYYRYWTDCANFVSQCLYAGKIDMTNDWHMYKNRKSFSVFELKALIPHRNYRYDWSVVSSWSVANDQYCFFSNTNNGYISGPVIHISSTAAIAYAAYKGGIQKGDLLYFYNAREGIHHATIITKVENGMIYYAGHTRSAYDKPLVLGMKKDTVLIVRIRDDA